jgi:ABC-type nitrate/sulfonate/bicarbonate transport system substrate-binding protein
MSSNRRTFLTSAAAVAGAAVMPRFARAAEPRTIKVGMLKTVNTVVMQFYQKFAAPGVTYEVIAFDSPPDGKDAVVSGSVDFGIFGLAAATLGAAGGQPVVVVAAAGGKAMAVVVSNTSTAKTFADLKGKKVGVQRGSTQEVVLNELLKMNSMTPADIQEVRMSFGDMANALAAGNVDAYVGSEPGPSINVLSGKGKVLMYPYGTPVGLLNVVFATRSDLVAKQPDYVREVVKTHVAACKWSSNPKNVPEFEAMTTKILGPNKETLDMAMKNINFDYMIDADYLAKAKYYGAQMVALGEIAKVPDYSTFINTSFLPK